MSITHYFFVLYSEQIIPVDCPKQYMIIVFTPFCQWNVYTKSGKWKSVCRGYRFGLCLYDFSVRFWNCSDSVILVTKLLSLFYHMPQYILSVEILLFWLSSLKWNVYTHKSSLTQTLLYEPAQCQESDQSCICLSRV